MRETLKTWNGHWLWSHSIGLMWWKICNIGTKICWKGWCWPVVKLSIVLSQNIWGFITPLLVTFQFLVFQMARGLGRVGLKALNSRKIFISCTFWRVWGAGFSVNVKVSYILMDNMIFALSTARKLYFIVFSVKRSSVWVSWPLGGVWRRKVILHKWVKSTPNTNQPLVISESHQY